ncbi:hypothetical protein [Mesorhizobium sp. CN2-181]|uniref:hypothetical protein n=1 Tax=Mesorhizobium yinganensis TaxID=3157707 RepID=UPI0032B79262
MTSVSSTLGADVHVEILTTSSSTATAAINLTGNELKQTITGNAGADILSDGRRQGRYHDRIGRQ